MEQEKKPWNRNPWMILGCILALMAVLFLIAIAGKGKGEKKAEDNLTKEEASSQEEQRAEENTSSEETTEEKSQKTSQDKTEKEDKTSKKEETTTAEEKAQAITKEDVEGLMEKDNEDYKSGQVTCSDFSSFSGAFAEDGTDVPVENIAAMKITNQSERFLDMAAFQYEIDGKEAVFIATGLAPGKSAWVLENTKLTIDADAEFVYKGCTTAFRDKAVTSTDKIKISSDGYMMTAKNKTKKTMKNLCVYYKVLHTDGNFFGGITYMVNFGDLKAGESLEKLAGHYDKKNAKIVRYSWQDES